MNGWSKRERERERGLTNERNLLSVFVYFVFSVIFHCIVFSFIYFSFKFYLSPPLSTPDASSFVADILITNPHQHLNEWKNKQLTENGSQMSFKCLQNGLFDLPYGLAQKLFASCAQQFVSLMMKVIHVHHL